MASFSEEKKSHEARDDSLESANPRGDRIKRTAKGLKLEPQPSDDPNDPLLWPISKKIRILVILSFASFVGVGQAAANQGGFVIQGELYGKSPTQVANSLSAAIAGLATAPFVWAWLSRKIGRTSVIFWAMLGNLGMNIWSACMTSPNDYIPFIISRWLGGSFGSAPSTIGAGIILDIFYLHQRGKAFACYTIATTFGPQVAGTLSGYIAATAPWPVYFWWTVAAIGLVCILFFFFIEDTTFDRANPNNKKPKLPFMQDRMATLLPGSAVVQSGESYLGFLDSIIIGVQPVSLFAGFFLMATFGWAVAVTTLLSVFVLTPVEEGGYGFSPLGYANLTLAQWLGVVIAEAYGLSCNDKIPLWRCRRNGGIWKPEYRLFPLLLPPMILLPTALGIFGAALQYHLHYMVLAFAVCVINITETALVPVMINYMNECFTGHAQEITTAMNFYRTILGLTVPFYVEYWTEAVGDGWTFGMMAFFALFAFLFAVVLAWKGDVIRKYTMKRFGQSEEGESLY